MMDVGKFLKIVPTLRQSPNGHLWSTYDEEADTLSINFKRPSVATDTDLTDDDVIVRYEGDEVVGLIILLASKR